MPTTERTSAATADPPSTVWGVYNEKARFRDKELLKDWDSSINGLLLFVSYVEYATEPVSDCLDRRPFLLPS
jgi:hypothetical protein